MRAAVVPSRLVVQALVACLVACTAASDAGPTDEVGADAADADASVPDGAVPDALGPDVAVPDAPVPDAPVPDAPIPDAPVPDAADSDVATDAETQDATQDATDPDVASDAEVLADASPDADPGDVAPDVVDVAPDAPDDDASAGLRADVDSDGDHVGDAHDLDPADPRVGLPTVAVADRVVLRVLVPPSTPSDAVVHVAGDFNGWTHAPMTRLEDGTWMLALAPWATPQRYKFTLGDWTREEGDFRGVGNDRSLAAGVAGQIVGHHVRFWAPNPAPAASIAGRVDVIAGVTLPGLGRDGTIRVYTPPGYETSGRHYPVLYMHDGQNVFDVTTSAFGAEWGVDEAVAIATLEEALPGVIVVAIDNGAARSCEYGPFPGGTGCESGPGLGVAYADALATVVKPLVDARYRTLPGRRNTGVAGSSRGGTATIVTAVHRYQTFGLVGAFSATARTDILAGDLAAWVEERPRTASSRWHFDYGDAEQVLSRTAAEMIAGLDPVIQAVRDTDPGQDVVRRVIVPGAVHTEAAWAARFGETLRWLYGTPVP